MHITPLSDDVSPQNLHRASLSAKYFFDYLSHFEVIKPFLTRKGLFFSIPVVFLSTIPQSHKTSHKSTCEISAKFQPDTLSNLESRMSLVPVCNQCYRRYFVIDLNIDKSSLIFNSISTLISRKSTLIFNSKSLKFFLWISSWEIKS